MEPKSKATELKDVKISSIIELLCQYMIENHYSNGQFSKLRIDHHSLYILTKELREKLTLLKPINYSKTKLLKYITGWGIELTIEEVFVDKLLIEIS